MLTAGTGRNRFLYDSSLTGRSTIVVVFVVGPIYTLQTATTTAAGGDW